MAKPVTAAEKVKKARELIAKARAVPVPAEGGKSNFTYLAEVRDLLRQARDLVKFLSYSVGTSPEMKKEVEAVMAEADAAQHELLRG